MRVYCLEQEDKYFLSPYASISYTENEIQFYQRLFDKGAIWECNHDLADKLLPAFQDGLAEDECIELLSQLFPRKYDAYELLLSLIQMGVLE